MKVSIVTVVYNNPQVREALDSILSQEADCEKELIVIDGGSKDGTLEVLRSYAEKISILVSEPDKGVWDAMNKGIRLATGDIVGTLNSDDVYYDKRALRHILRAFEDPTVDVVYGDLVMVEREDTRRIFRYWKSCPYRSGLFEGGWQPPHPTLYVRRRIFKTLGVLDPDCPTPDHEFPIRLLHNHGLKSNYISQILVRMRLGGISTANRWGFLTVARQTKNVAKSCGVKVGPFYVLRKALHKFPQIWQRPRPDLVG